MTRLVIKNPQNVVLSCTAVRFLCYSIILQAKVKELQTENNCEIVMCQMCREKLIYGQSF